MSFWQRFKELWMPPAIQYDGRNMVDEMLAAREIIGRARGFREGREFSLRTHDELVEASGAILRLLVRHGPPSTLGEDFQDGWIAAMRCLSASQPYIDFVQAYQRVKALGVQAPGNAGVAQLEEADEARDNSSSVPVQVRAPAEWSTRVEEASKQ